MKLPVSELLNNLLQRGTAVFFYSKGITFSISNLLALSLKKWLQINLSLSEY